jgi:Tfp pilus assembly protein PilV
MRQKLYNQAGDTIVEVIIAVLVVSTIIAGAFAVTNRSTRAVRDSEEHAEALQLLQGQVELVRAAAASSGTLTTAILTQNGGFCLDTTLKAYAGGSGSCAGAGGAMQLSLSVKCSALSAGCPAPAGTTTVFDLQGNWPAIGGGTASVFLSYKVEVAP